MRNAAPPGTAPRDQPVREASTARVDAHDELAAAPEADLAGPLAETLRRIMEAAEARQRKLRCESCDTPYSDMTPIREYSRSGHGYHMLCDRCGERAEAAWTAQENAERFARIARQFPRMAGWSWDSYPTDAQGAGVAEAVRGWLHDEARPSHLYVHGRIGAGKSGAAWCALREHVETGGRGAFANTRDLLAAVRRTYNDDRAPDPIEGLADVDLLVLDDLGAERPTEWALETIANLVEHRYGNLRRTIITSNYQPGKLIERFNRGDPILGQRIVSRLREDCTVLHVSGSDRRVSGE